ncbi:MAG: beta-galactosidase [Clostridia bacterium]|nr:beta-galactosidase [Clostridia bacterium]
MLDIQAKEIFGGEIQYFRLDPQYWEEIVRAFAETGLRTVTAYVPWECHLVVEPNEEHPDGVYDFTGETDPRLNLMLFLEIIEKYGLNLNFRCGPFCCAELPYGGHPRFVVKDLEETFSLNNEDKFTKGYFGGSYQPSYMHPVYLEWVRKWFGEMAKIIIPHLKVNGGCITMINLDNEVSYIVQDSFLQSDYNPVNVAPGGYYHQFLKETYGTVENLPYRTRYTAFEEIPAPRSVPEDIDDDYAYYADWMKFHTWIMCRFIVELRKMHEANGITSEQVIFMTNYDPHLPEGVPTRMPDFEEAAEGITGYDFYRGTFMSYSGYQSLARVMKLMTDTLKFPYSSEFMAGTWEKVLSSRVSDDHMRFMARCALAHGCKAIQWYMFHDRDGWGDSPVSIHGHKRPSIDVLTETPVILFDKIKNWDAMKPLNDIGIIYDLTAHLHTSFGDPMPCNDGKLHIGAPKIDGVRAGLASAEYIGMFRLAEQNGVQAAAIDIHYSDASLRQYPLVVYPGSPVIAAKTEEQLLNYVQNGGILAITGVLPTRYETGEKCTFFGGVQVGENVIGKGKVYFVDKYLGQGESEKDDLNDIAAFGELLNKANVVPRVGISCDALKLTFFNGPQEQPRMLGSAVLQEANGETILFVLNHHPDAHCFKLHFSIPAKKLVCLTEGRDAVVENGMCELDIDRKCCEIYRVE